jgi:hypothetical protein
MKKTIKILVEKMNKLQEKKDGTLHGGFASIMGGFNSDLLFSTNSNPAGGCTNSSDCTHSTNTYKCTNSGTCFM